MVSFCGINYPFQTGGISSLEFVPGICSLALDRNINPSYLDVENMLSSSSAVEMTNSSPYRIAKRNATDEVTQIQLRGILQTSLTVKNSKNENVTVKMGWK